MALPDKEEVATIRKTFSTPSPTPYGHTLSREEALRLKELGNNHFRKKCQDELCSALQCYTKAIFICPWPEDKRNKLAKEFLESLNPRQQDVMGRTLQSPRSSVVDDDRGVTQILPEDCTLLATCFGNRSAVLYDLANIKECLADIQRALLLGFPRDSEYKLHRRRACCMGQLGHDEEAYEALSLTEHSVKKSSLNTTKKEQVLREQQSFSAKIQGLLKSSKEKRKRPDVAGRTGSFQQPSCSAQDSEHISVKYSAEKGRFLEATKQIKPGQIILTEQPFAAVLNQEFLCTHCSQCFTETVVLIPCCWCSSEGYCSPECRKKAWTRYHWLECPVSHIWNKMDWMLRLCLRLVLTAVAMENQGSYSSIRSLVSHKNYFSDHAQQVLMEKMADTLVESFGEPILKLSLTEWAQSGLKEINSAASCHTSHLSLEAAVNSRSDASSSSWSLVQLRELFLHHLLQLRCNTHSISVVRVEEKQAKTNDVPGSTSDKGLVQTTSEVQLGSAIYPSASLVNHSCLPNALFSFSGSTVSVCATRDVQPGEEICNCYGPQVGRMTRAQRQAELKKKYFFDCTCPACCNPTLAVQYREAVVDAFACPNCRGPLTFQETSSDYLCTECKNVLSETEMTDKKKVKEEAEDMFHAAVDNNFHLPLLLKCQKLQSEVLHRHNMELAQTNDAIAQVYAMQGDSKSAAHYCELSCQAVEVVYGNSGLELANELQKLAQLLFHNHHYSKALEVAKRAHGILLLHRDPQHPDCVELSEMIEALTV